jgi:hypothetical protein
MMVVEHLLLVKLCRKLVVMKCKVSKMARIISMCAPGFSGNIDSPVEFFVKLPKTRYFVNGLLH